MRAYGGVAILIVLVSAAWGDPRLPQPVIPAATQPATRPTAWVPVVPNHKVQAQLQKVWDAPTQPAILREIADLTDLMDQPKVGKAEMLRQLALFTAHLPRELGLGGTGRAVYVLDCLSIDLDIVLNVAIPGMHADDALESAFTLVFERAVGIRFDEIEEYLIQHRDEPAEKLVAWMCRRWPQAAGKSMLKAYRPSDAPVIRSDMYAVNDAIEKQKIGLVDSEHVNRDAEEALGRLSLSEHWWVRAYAAGIVRSYFEFHDDAMVQRLQRDKHPTVQALVEGVPVLGSLLEEKIRQSSK